MSKAAKRAAVKKLKALDFEYRIKDSLNINEYELRRDTVLTQYETAIRASIAEDEYDAGYRQGHIDGFDKCANKEMAGDIPKLTHGDKPNKGGK